MNFLVGHISVFEIEIQNWLVIVIIFAVISILYITTLEANGGTASLWWEGLVDPLVARRLVSWLNVAAPLTRKINTNRHSNAIWVFLAFIAISLLTLAVLSLLPDNLPTITTARFIDTQADIVSCEPLGLRPDGKTDGVIEFSYELNAPLFFQNRTRELRIRLDRTFPPGVNETGNIFYILAIAETPGGSALNGQDGRYFDRNTRHLYAHFCRDGHDTSESAYTLSIEQRPASVLRSDGRVWP